MRLVCFIILSGILSVAAAQPWVMFSDLDDTYLYDQASGQVYIRVKKGGKNYEDTFVKMGVQDSINATNNAKKQVQKQESKPKDSTKEAQNATNIDEQQKLLKQAQELQRSIQATIFNGENN